MSELHVAVLQSNVRRVKQLLSGPRAVDVNAVDGEGRTALHLAMKHSLHKIVKILLRCPGVDVTIRDKSGKLASQLAPDVSKKHLQLMFSKLQAEALEERRPKDVLKVYRDTLTEDRRMLEDNKVESADMVNPRVLRKVIICVFLPFLVLIFINGIRFALEFLSLTFLFYFVALGYFISEITVRPPWYHHHPQATRLTMRGCPDYWNGMIHDPLVDFGLPFEDVAFSSTDHYTLRGWYVPGPATGTHGEAAKATGIVLVHGAGRDRRTWLRHVPFLHQAGYACLLFDLREHGLSDGAMRGTVYGMKERFDVVAACEFMRTAYKFERVCAMGTSMGGSSVIMAAAIDTSIDMVIAENPLLTGSILQDHQIVTVLGGYFSRAAYSLMLFSLLRRTCSFWLNWRMGNKPSKHCQALHSISKISPRPVLLMHGTADELVPVRHSQVLFERALEPKQLYLSDGSFHCGLHNTHREEYELVVLRFLERHLDSGRVTGAASASPPSTPPTADHDHHVQHT